METRDYLRLVTRRWPTIVALTLVVVAISAFLTIQAKPRYASTAQMFVSTPQSDGNEAYQGGLFSQQRAKSYARLITGEEIAKQVIDETQVALTPGQLSDEVTSEVILDTVILTVTVTDEDAERAQLLAQATAEKFVTYVAELETPEGQDLAPVKATIVDPAELPSSPVSPQPVLNLTLGLLLGLAIGVAVAIARELLDTSVKNPDDLARVLNTAVLGDIQYDKETPDQPLITSLGTHHPRVESIRILRTNLQFIDIDNSKKVFVISSAVTGEGKSTTAINLALSLSQAGLRVALVEGDLRRPRISEYLGVEGAVGLSTVMVGRVALGEALQESVVPGLDVLTSGRLPPNPSEILQTDAMANLIAELRGMYEVVIIDAPPLLPVTDASLLATLADGVILVVRSGKTTREQVRLSVERLEGVGAQLMGVVFNMSPRRKASGYGYGYGDDFVTAAPLPEPGGRIRRMGRRKA